MVFKKMGNWMSKTSQGLIESKIVLYILVVLVIVNLYNYSMIGDEVYAGVMLLIGFLTSFFSKNMIVILFTSIAVTNLIRFGTELSSKEGFAGLDIDTLTDHVTSPSTDDDPTEEEVESGLKNIDMGEIDKKVQDEITNMNLAETELNKDPEKRDQTLDKLVKGVSSSSMLSQLDKSINTSQLELAKDKLTLAMKHSNRIANEQQRKEVESIFSVQMKLIDQLMNISPLVNEFKDILKSANH
jgi:hypothetical protein